MCINACTHTLISFGYLRHLRQDHPSRPPSSCSRCSRPPVQSRKASRSSCAETPVLSPTQELQFYDSIFDCVCHVFFFFFFLIPCYHHGPLCFSVFVFLVDKAPPWCCPPFLDLLPSTAHSAPLCCLRHVKKASFLPESQPLALRSPHLSLDAGFLGSRTTGSGGPSQLRAPQGFLLPLRGHRAQPPAISFPASLLKQLCLQGSLGDVWRHSVTPGGNAVGIWWGKGRKAAIGILQGTWQPSPQGTKRQLCLSAEKPCPHTWF